MSSESSTSPNPTPNYYPPAPWFMRGQNYMSVWRVPLHRCTVLVDEPFEPVTVAGRMFVTVSFVDYEPGSTLSYGELTVGIVVKQKGARRYGTVTPLIWVDNEQSVRGGRALWNLPKEMARFEFDREPPGGGFGATAWDTRGRKMGRARFELLPGLPRDVRFPVGIPDLYVIQGKVYETKESLSCSFRLLRGYWSIPEDSPLAALGIAGEKPMMSLWMRDLEVKLPTALPVEDR